MGSTGPRARGGAQKRGMQVVCLSAQVKSHIARTSGLCRQSWISCWWKMCCGSGNTSGKLPFTQ